MLQFWIFDFRFWNYAAGNIFATIIIPKLDLKDTILGVPYFQNRKSKIQNC